jgi:hypothetical protein
MLVAKGFAVTIFLESGRKVRAASGAELLHDESGADWPACSGLVASFTKTGKTLPEKDTKADKHFGLSGYVIRRGKVRLPPSDLSEWHLVGRAKSIDYSRRGEHADRYTHTFQDSGFWLWKHDLPSVYRRGKSLRIELGSGCTWNWRGFVTP